MTAKAALSATGKGAEKTATASYAPHELLVRFKPSQKSGDTVQKTAARTSAIRSVNGNVVRDYGNANLDGLYLVEFPATESLAEAKARLDADPAVEYTSLNYLRSLSAAPDDPDYPLLWGLDNTGQDGGTPGADINVSGAWDTTTGSPSVVVALLDTGVDYNHPDLAGNMWTNTGEIPDNGIDDDSNGFIDDSRGWNFGMDNNDPMDSYGHGTHCAGTIGAVGNNGIGVAGVNWNVRIMPLRVSRLAGSIYDSDAIDAIHYAGSNGAGIISCSWGGYGYDQAMKEAIDASPCLFVFAAGNNDMDNDILPEYPASYTSRNIISVAASDNNDERAYFSNYGRTSVDIAAPGVGVRSTLPELYAITDPVFSDNFTTLTRWHNAGTQAWSLNASSYTSPPTSVSTGAYVNNGLYYLDMKNPVPLAGMSNPVLEFEMKGQTEKNYDYFCVFVSTNGSYWYPIDEESGNFGNWSVHRYSLRDFKGQPVYISLGLEADGSYTYPGISIDDLKIGNGTSPVPQYGNYSGTSMATPHVAGIAALVKAHDPMLTVQEIKDHVLLTAEPLPQWQGSTVTGGRADAWSALSPVPRADISAAHRTGIAPLTVLFTEHDINSPTSRAWDFGDGDATNASLESPVHTYQSPGTYSVNLTVTNADGSTSTNRTGFVRVYDRNASGWMEMEPLPAPRILPAVESAGNGVYVIGGLSDLLSSSPLTDVYRYDLFTNTWESRKPIPVSLFADDAATVGNKIYVPGDLTNATTFVYDTASDSWSEIPPNNGYSPRSYYQAVASGTDVVVLGGVKISPYGATNEVWRLDTLTGEWSAGVPLPEARRSFSAGSCNDRIIITGGSGTGSELVSTRIFDGTRWNTGASIPSGGVRYPAWEDNAVGQTPEAIWLAGGFRQTTSLALNQTGVYFPGNNTWATSPALPGLNQPRVYTSGAVAPDGYFYAAGGIDLTATPLDSFERMRVEPTSLLPAAGFSANVTYGRAPALIGFTDTSTGSPASWNWSFGDGEFAETQNPSHLYALPGNYTVTLNVTNPLGSGSMTKAGYINLGPPASTDPVRTVPVSGTVYIGESALNISQGVGTNDTLRWFVPGKRVIALFNISGSADAFTISPFFAFDNNPVTPYTRTGPWYSDYPGFSVHWGANNEPDPGEPPAFIVQDPSIGLEVTDLTRGTSADSTTIPVGDELSLAVTTNISIAGERGIGGVPVTVIVQGPGNRTYTTLINRTGTVTPLQVILPGQSWDSGPSWDTENSLYPAGQYAVTARLDLNGMSATYPVVGKTISRTTTFNLSATPLSAPPLPVITAITPLSGSRNTTAAFVITGKNFRPGETIVEFRNNSMGIIVTTLDTVTPTRIEGTVAIPGNATPGPWNLRIVTTSGGEVTKPNAFAIGNISKPTLGPMVPAGPYYRNQTINYTITGTNFQPGMTVVLFRNRTGNELNATPGNSGAWLITPTKIYGNVTVPFSASSATPYNITVTTLDGGTVAWENAITVSALPLRPVIVSMMPAGPWYRNKTINYTITGANFQPGNTVVLFRNRTGSALNGSPSVINSGAWLITPTMIYGNITVPFEASSATPYNITISTLNGGTVAREAAFTISALPLKPTIVSMTPAGPWYRNQTVNYTITGTNFQPDNTLVLFRNSTGSALNDSASAINSGAWLITPTKIYGNITIPFNASSATPYRITVSTLDGGTVTRESAFTISALPLKPTIVSMMPAGPYYRNQTVNYTITGTNFQPDNTIVLFRNRTGSALKDSASVINSGAWVITPTKIYGNITIPFEASSATPYNVTVSTFDGGTVALENAFTISAVPLKPGIVSMLPAGPWYRNQTVNYTITGTNFQPGSTVVIIRNTTGNELNATPANSGAWLVTPTKIYGNVTVPFNASSATPYSLAVSTLNGGTVVKENAFTISALPPRPTIVSMSPSGPYYRNKTVNYTITGTNFQPGNTVVLFRNRTGNALNGSGLVVNSGAWLITPTQVYGTITVPFEASSATPYNVTITTLDGGTVAKEGAFTVSGAPLKPAVTAITPAGPWYRNATVNYTITGTNFQPGHTEVTFLNATGKILNASSGAGVWLVTPTKIYGTVVVPQNAPLTPWNISVSTLDGDTSGKTAAFTIATALKPTISAISPAGTWYRNATVRFQITGTNFQPGTTSVTLRYALNGTHLNRTDGITIDTVTPTSIRGSVVVPSGAPAGLWNVNVTTLDGGRASKPAAFSVAQYPKPVITSITPTSGFRNSTVSFTIKGANFQPGLTSVDLSYPAYGELNASVYAVTDTQIIGGVSIPSGAAPGAWKLNVTTSDGGKTTRVSAFNVNRVLTPKITSFTPSSAPRGTLISFTVNGNYFQPGGRTSVNLTRQNESEIETILTSVYPTRITGTVTVPGGAVAGPWKFNVTTIDGHTGTSLTAVTVY